MKSRDEILDILRREKANLMQRWPITGLALFGSVARGEQTSASDVDILVELNGKLGLGFVSLAYELEDLLGERVDLISRRSVRPNYWERIAPDVLEVFHA